MEGLQTPDGEPLAIDTAEVETEFAKAMTAPADEAAPPPKRQVTENTEPKRRGRPPKAERARVTTSKPETAKASPELDAERKDGVKGLVQIGAGLCMVMDSRVPDNNISWRCDAVTLASNADGIADACAETAKHNASFAAALDKITQAGPYAALVGVMMSVGAQLARNHGVKAAEMLGAEPPEKIIAALEDAKAAA
jgi:hypothetical protein